MNKKLLLSSLMSIAMLASITTGATYALFTAEDTVNVNVTAGRVNVTARVLETFSIKSLDTELVEVKGEGTFSSGGKVTVDSQGNITLDRIVPGDRVEFTIDVVNDSNVDVNYRSILTATGGLELYSGLVVTIDEAVYNGMTAYSKWEYLTPGEGSRQVKVTIELPKEAGNEYQNLSTSIHYTVSALQGNAEIVKEENADENTTFIYSETDFRLFAMSVNNGETYKGKTVKLMSNIDLANKEWTPIGNSNNKFQGTFDGQNFPISNLNVGESTLSNVGLFGFTTDGSIKNVHVHNADVDGRLNVGVIAGTPYTSTYENIKVTGDVTVDGMAYVGGLFGKNVYANVNNLTVDVTEESYVNANSVENGVAYRTYVGGVMGFVGEGSHVISNVTSNIDVLGSTIDVGGITGIAHYGNTFENCVSSGDVTLYSYEDEGTQYEIGGIAGVWNNGGSDVTINNCEFTGTLKAINSNGEVFKGSFFNNGLVGKAYNNTGTGKLIINNKEQANTLTALVRVLESLNAGETFTLESDITGDAASSNGYGATGISVKGIEFDGNGHTLTVNNANSTWDSVISTTGGTIKDVTVSGAMRGIFMPGASADLIIDNVTFEDVIYTFNSDAGSEDYSVTVKNSRLNGWTSFSDCHKSVDFENCSFGEGSGYKFCRPYNVSTFTNCEFVKGFGFDARNEVVFVNCYYDGTLITSENVESIFGVQSNGTIIVKNA